MNNADMIDEEVYDFEVLSKGIMQDGVTWYVDMNIMYERDGTIHEYKLYCTSNGILENKMEIVNFRVEFLDPTYYNTKEVAYDADLFEDIYDSAFDEFYCIFDEMRLKKVH